MTRKPPYLIYAFFVCWGLGCSASDPEQAISNREGRADHQPPAVGTPTVAPTGRYQAIPIARARVRPSAEHTAPETDVVHEGSLGLRPIDGDLARSVEPSGGRLPVARVAHISSVRPVKPESSTDRQFRPASYADTTADQVAPSPVPTGLPPVGSTEYRVSTEFSSEEGVSGGRYPWGEKGLSTERSHVAGPGAQGVYAGPGPAYHPGVPRGAQAGARSGKRQTPAFDPCELPNVYGSVDYLLWWTRGSDLPPLVTTSPVGTPRGSVGTLGLPATEILYGGDNLNNDLRSGYRVTSGMLLSRDKNLAVESTFFALADANSRYLLSSTGNPIIARPFLDTRLNGGNSELIAFPNVVAGSVAVTSAAYNFWGTETNVRAPLFCSTGDCSRGFRVDLLSGYRYVNLDDSLQVAENLTASGASGVVVNGTTIVVADSFRARNDFHGGQFGMQGRFYRGRSYLDLLGKCAIGKSFQDVTINGLTTITDPNAPSVTRTGGLLALPSNIGHFHQSEFAVIPEFGVNLGVMLTERLSASVGYTFVYWSSVLRAGDQIDTTVNTSQIPPGTLVGDPRPLNRAADTDFWAQGINGRLELRF